jgi:hypothetical protein
MWDPHKRYTQEVYIAMVRKAVRDTLWGQKQPIVDGVRHQPLWWLHREFRVFWEPGIADTTVLLVEKEIKDLCRELGIGMFSFQNFGSHDSAMEQIRSSLRGDELDEQQLFQLAVSEHWRDERVGGRQHGDIYITRQSFVNDRVSWGAASFPHGALMLTLHGNRQQNHGFLRGLVRHEATHLFGMSCHCDDFQNVESYRYTRSCNMHYEIPSGTLCPKCSDFVRAWWCLLNDVQAQVEAS